MKSILIALDQTPSSISARKVGWALADASQAAVQGLGVVDVPRLTAAEPVGIGGSHYKQRADAEKVLQARIRLEQAAATFEEESGRLGLAAGSAIVDGDPLEEIRRAADAHDLIVIGRDTSFHAEPDDDMADLVETLLEGNPRPVVVVPEQAPRLDTVILAFDGSLAASRALQMFTLLRVHDRTPVHVVSVARRDADAQALVERAKRYLDLHDIPAETHGIGSAADPADILAAEVRSMKAGLVVMGAFGHRGLRELLLGSCTKALLGGCPASLFVHH